MTLGSSLGLPAKPWNLKNVKAWGKALAERGEPQGSIYKRAQELQGQTKYPKEMEAFMALTNAIEDTWVDRNLKGKDYEKAGEDGKAIRLYEANVKDGFDGSHPYERLRILYTERGREQDVKRVCEAFVKHGHDAALIAMYQRLLGQTGGLVH